jgi:hypothetical protein
MFLKKKVCSTTHFKQKTRKNTEKVQKSGKCSIFARIKTNNMGKSIVKIIYTEEQKVSIITAICDKVILNKTSFNQEVDESEITLVSFYKWIAKNKDLQDLYNYAREVRSDVLFEQIVDIADTTEEGVVVKDGKNGIETRTGDMIEHRRLRVEARKWVVSKMCPKKYGDKIDVTTNNESINNKNITLTEEMLNSIIDKL